MKPITVTKILVPVDFSSTSLIAFEHAVTLAKHFNAQLHLLHVIEKTFYTHDIFLPETKMVNMDNIARIADEKLKELGESVDLEKEVMTSSLIADSKVSREIVKSADRIGADMIIMGTHGSSGIEEFFLGSNAERVVVNAHCPVLTIHESAKIPGFSKIVLPIDNSTTSRQKLAHAVFFAKHSNAKIYVLGLLSEDDDPEHVKTFEYKITQVNEYLEKNSIPHESKIVHSSEHANLTMKYADEIAADLLIIMTEQELDGPGFFLGVSAQRIVNHSNVPVLSVSPEGFSVGWTRNNPV